MATRNFVPRGDGEGSIGTPAKNWLGGYFKRLNVADVTVDGNKKPTSDTTDLMTLLSNIATMIKQNKGTPDWKADPATNLATLATLASNLASGSDVKWDGQKFTNTKLGITGLIATNGYICFGKNFGGLILQWGVCSTYNSNGTEKNYFPIRFSVINYVSAGVIDCLLTNRYFSANIKKDVDGFYISSNFSNDKFNYSYFSLGY